MCIKKIVISGVSLRIAVAGKQCKVIGEYISKCEELFRKELEGKPGNFAF